MKNWMDKVFEPGAVRELRRQLDEAWERVRVLEGLYQRTPKVVTEAGKSRENLERLMVLSGQEETELWKVVLKYLDEHESNELEYALKPDLNDEVRQFNAGRAACARDLAFAFRELMVEATRRNKGTN